jgi:hypothetical protein
MYIQVVDESIGGTDFSVFQIAFLPSRYLDLDSPPTPIVEHKQRIFRRACSGSELELQHYSAKIDISDRMVAMKVDMLSWEAT